MNVMDAVREAIKDLVLPDLALLRESGERVESRLTVVEKGFSGVERRLDDVNLHLVDQSRRIDAVREELGGRIDAVREELGGRIDQLSGRIDQLSGRFDQLSGRFDQLNGRIDETNGRIDAVREELSGKDDQINKRLDRLYEIIVRRDEHVVLVEKVERLESDVSEIKRKLAA